MGWTGDQNIDSYEEILFLGKIYCFYQKRKINAFLIKKKFRFFAIRGRMTIFNKCSKFQNDLINTLGDMTSLTRTLISIQNKMLFQ